MGHCVAQQQRLRLRKFTVLEYEHEFATIRIEALNRVRDPAWEKPKIVFLHIGDKTLAVRVNRRNPRRPVKHEGPLAGGVPMQLPDPSGCQSHVYARQLLGDGQFPNSHFTRPSAFISALARKKNGYLKFSTRLLESVAGGQMESRFWPSSTVLAGPGSLLLRSAPTTFCNAAKLPSATAVFPMKLRRVNALIIIALEGCEFVF